VPILNEVRVVVRSSAMAFHMQTIFGALLLLLGVRSLESEAPLEDGLDETDAALEEADLRKLFRWFDADGDGRASLDDIMAFSMKMRQQLANSDGHTVLDEMDTDKSNTLSLKELEADVEQWGHQPDEEPNAKEHQLDVERAKFKAADSNKDGVLDKSEMPSYFYPETNPSVLEVMTVASLKDKDRDADGKLSIKEFWESDLATDAGELEFTDEEKSDFDALDLNKDHFLDLAELRDWESGEFHTREGMRKMIEMADQNHDMHITADEIVKANSKIAGTDAEYTLNDWINSNWDVADF